MTEQLSNKIDALIKAYKTLVKERNALKGKLEHKEDELKSLQDELKKSQKARSLKQASITEDDKLALRNELDTVIQEIDKIILSSEA